MPTTLVEEKQEAKKAEVEICQQGMWIRGECEHGTQRWVRLPCKRRDCPICGKRRLQKMARRIDYGLQVLGEGSGGWFIGTWDKDIDKKTAVKIVGKFIRWLRKKQPTLQYATTLEVTKKGRLHVNIIMAPWLFVAREQLRSKWHRFGGGYITWIERVGSGIGSEASKSTEEVSKYIGKWDQMVMSGRGVTYSKGWPKLPENIKLERKGNITWIPECGKWARREGEYAGEKQWACLVEPLHGEAVLFESDMKAGYWVEVSPGEYASAMGEKCDCFEIDWDYIDMEV